MTKEQIVKKFMDEENAAVYQTNAAEIGQLYDTYVSHLKLGLSFQQIAVKFKALKLLQGIYKEAVLCDRMTKVHDQDKKREVEVPVVFRYTVFRFFESCLANNSNKFNQ